MTTEQQANPTADQSPTPTLAAASRRAAKRLIWFLGLLYFINYLDRTNISFAGPNGMNQDLGLTQTMFGPGLGRVLHRVPAAQEVPSNMALHRFGARRWIARIMVSWGIVATAMTWVPERAVALHPEVPARRRRGRLLPGGFGPTASSIPNSKGVNPRGSTE